MVDDLRLTKHFRRRLFERVRDVAEILPTSLTSLSEFLKTEGLFFLTYDRRTIFIAIIGIVLVVAREHGRWTFLTTYPADWQFKYRQAFGALEPITYDELAQLEEENV